MRKNPASAPELASLGEASSAALAGNGLLLPHELTRSHSARPPTSDRLSQPWRTSVDLWREVHAGVYFRWLQRRAQLVLCFWLVMTAAAYLYGQDALNLTTTQSNGPPNMKAQAAQDALGDSFPQMLWDQAVILVRCNDGCDIFNPQVELFVSRLEQLLQQSYLPSFQPPLSIFTLLPTDAQVGGGEADAELTRALETLRHQAIARQEQRRSSGQYSGQNTSTQATITSLHHLIRNVSSGDPRLPRAAAHEVEAVGDAFVDGITAGVTNLSAAPLFIPGAPSALNVPLERLSNGSLVSSSQAAALSNMTSAESVHSLGEAFRAGVRKGAAASQPQPANGSSLAIYSSFPDSSLAESGSGELTSAGSGEETSFGSGETDDSAADVGSGSNAAAVQREKLTRLADAFVQAASQSASVPPLPLRTPATLNASGSVTGQSAAAASNASAETPLEVARRNFAALDGGDEQDAKLAAAIDDATQQLSDAYDAALRSEQPVHIPPGTARKIREICTQRTSAAQSQLQPGRRLTHPGDSERRQVAEATAATGAVARAGDRLSLQLPATLTGGGRGGADGVQARAPSTELATKAFDVTAFRGDEQLDLLCTSPLAKVGLDALTDAAGNTAAAIRRLFLSASGTATLVSVPLLPGYEAHIHVVQAYLISTVGEAARQALPREQYEVLVGGDSQMRLDTSVATLDDFHRVDLVSMPLALCALMIFLTFHQATSLKSAARNFPSACRLLVVPILCIPAAVSAALAILKLAAALGMPLNFVVPALVLATVVAVSIDYALFLLSSYSAALSVNRGGADGVEQAVLSALQDSGHTVLMSGCVLALAFLPTALFPLDWMLTLGICSSSSVLCAVLINITLGPALLLSTPFLSKPQPEARPAAATARSGSAPEHAGEDAAADPAQRRSADDATAAAAKPKAERPPQQQLRRRGTSWLQTVKKFDYWSQFGGFLVTHPALVVTVSLVLLSPIWSIALTKSEFMAMPTQIVPRSTPSGAVMVQLEQEFGGGRMYPFYLYVRKRVGPTSRVRETIVSASFFHEAQEVVQQLAANVKNTPRVNITGVAFANGEPVPFELIEMAFDEQHPLYDSPTGQHLRDLCSVFFSPLMDATFFFVTFGSDPFGPLAKEWLRDAREFLDAVSEASMYDWEIAGMPAITLDTQDAVMARFALTASATGVCILALLAYAFGSALLPVRSVLTTAMTLGFVYGSLQILQAGVPYRFLVIELSAPWVPPGVSWIVPVMTFTVLAGLNTDYDVFLVSGIRKMRSQGLSNNDAIIQGLRSNGGVINTAGLIMALAFSGLLGSSTLAVQQVAYVVVLSVLFDTLVVRSILVPAMMALLKDYNWWPAQMPAVVEPKDVSAMQAALHLPHGHKCCL